MSNRSGHGRRIHVLFVLHSFGTGGSERIVLDICRGIDRGRFEPHVVSLTGGDLAQRFHEAGIWNQCLQKRGGVDTALMMRIGKIMRDKAIDVVNAHHFSPFVHAYLGCQARPCQVIYTDHTIREIENVSPFWTLVARVALRRCYGVVGISPGVADALGRKFHVPKAKVFVIPNAIDLERFRRAGDARRKREELGIPEGCRVVGIVGNLREQKNHANLIRAFRGMLDAGVAARLLIIGEGALRAELTAMRDALGMQEDVQFLGARLDIAELYRVMDVYCLSSRYEGLPLTILEAMASGVPVVGTDVAGIREIVQHGKTGVLVEDDDAPRLTQGLLGVLGDPERARSMADEGRRYVEASHAMGPWIERYEALFQAANLRNPGDGQGVA